MTDRIDLAAIRARVAEVGMAECARCHTPTHINDIVGGDLCIGCDTDDANASVLEGLRLCVQCEDTEAEFASSLCIDCSEGFASDLDTCDECGHNPRQCDAFETDNALLKQMVDKLRTENVLMREIIAGRDRAPTDAEIEAHAKAGGWWQWADADTFEHVMGVEIPDLLTCTTVERWWALDASGAPCAWPVVTEVEP